MKVLTMSALTPREEYEIGKFLGVQLFAYRQSIMGNQFIYTKVNAESEYYDYLLKKDYGESFSEEDYDDVYSPYADELRFDTNFIEYVEKHSEMFGSIEIHEIQEGTPFIIRFDDDLGTEWLEYLNNVKVYTVKNGELKLGI